ncbi:MAG: hypothetical protein ABIJ46_04485 [bacterium]
MGLLALTLPLPLGARAALALAYLLGLGAAVGWRSLPRENPVWRTILGALEHLSVFMALGGLTYLLHDLSAASVFALVLISPLVTTLWSGRRVVALPYGNEPKCQTSADRRTKGRIPRWLTAAVGAIFALSLVMLVQYGFGLLSGVATELSIRSPWDDVPRLFFIVVFLLAAGAFSLALGRLSGSATLPAVMGLAVLSTSVAVSVYSIGFGFDPFIHQATELHIFRFGEMLPKPPYYLGQYALVTAIARMVGGHVVAIDRWLVPFGFALTVPVAYWSLRRSFGWSGPTAAASTLGLLLLPLAPFVLTTPQGLADIFAILTVLACLPMAVRNDGSRRLPLALALATTAIHPLAGGPLLLFVLALCYLRSSTGWRRRPKLRWSIFAKLMLIMAVSLPLLFMLNAAVSGTQVTLDGEAVSAPTTIIEALKSPDLVTRRFSAPLDFAYGWRKSRVALLSLLGAIGLALLWLSGRRPDGGDSRREAAIAFAAGALALLSNFVLLRTWVQFPFLIEYERNNYADRLADLTVFLLVPPLLYLLGRLVIRIRRHGFPTLALGLTLLLAATVTANVYLAYPRRDRYESSRGWSTSAADVEAVRSIDAQAGDRPYVVLANQSVSAAAIRELGFRTYFEPQGQEATDSAPVFFYPVPTGGPLYGIFLDMNEDLGRRRTVKRAFDLTGAETAFYVVDHYWWQAQQIVFTAKQEASDWWVEDDRVWVFRYDRR